MRLMGMQSKLIVLLVELLVLMGEALDHRTLSLDVLHHCSRIFGLHHRRSELGYALFLVLARRDYVDHHRPFLWTLMDVLSRFRRRGGRWHTIFLRAICQMRLVHWSGHGVRTQGRWVWMRSLRANLGRLRG